MNRHRHRLRCQWDQEKLEEYDRQPWPFPMTASQPTASDRFRGISSDINRDFVHRFSHMGLTPHRNG